ncbi:MAG TPA: hypothetical protein VGS41_02970 [Chthonomonadales bacterium]|nr:hypothetical protein [Chthonomonadales bacterium]
MDGKIRKLNEGTGTGKMQAPEHPGPSRLARYAGFAIVIAAVVGGFVLVNWRVGIGLAVLAGLRTLFLLRQERQTGEA